MKLRKVKIRNFRCYQEEFVIDINDLTVIVGKNDVGKSAIFDALNIFFEEGKIDSDDASVNGEKSDVRITCEFDCLPDNLIIDSDFPTDLKNEFLLNGNGKLEITKVYNCSLKAPKLSGAYAIAVHPSKEKYNDLLLLKREELKKRAKELGVNLENVNEKINTQLRRAIWGSEINLELKAQEIPLDKETAKNIWDQLQYFLPVFALFKSDRQSTDQDDEAQDPLKAAIDEALKGQAEELQKITDKVREEILILANDTIEKIKELDPVLASELMPRFDVVKWNNIFKVSLTGDDQIPMNKRGSGVRRLFLFSFFRAAAEKIISEKNSPGVIYAIEEPETSQHPNNQKILMRIFEELSSVHNYQVVITTHTPTLTKLTTLQNLRFIDRDENNVRIVYTNDENTFRKVSDSLGILPDNDVKLFVGVEGINDENFLINYSKMLIKHGEDIPDLEKLVNEDKLIFISLGGGNLIYWKTKLKGLNRPEFYITDRDNPPPKQPKYKKFIDDVNIRQNCCAICTNKKEMENYIHPKAMKAVSQEVDFQHIDDFDDVPEMVARKIHESSNSTYTWEQLKNEKRDKYDDKLSNAKRWLNTKAIENMTPELLTEIDPNNEVRGWLKKIKEFCEKE